MPKSLRKIYKSKRSRKTYKKRGGMDGQPPNRTPKKQESINKLNTVPKQKRIEKAMERPDKPLKHRIANSDDKPIGDDSVEKPTPSTVRRSTRTITSSLKNTEAAAAKKAKEAAKEAAAEKAAEKAEKAKKIADANEEFGNFTDMLSKMNM